MLQTYNIFTITMLLTHVLSFIKLLLSKVDVIPYFLLSIMWNAKNFVVDQLTFLFDKKGRKKKDQFTFLCVSIEDIQVLISPSLLLNYKKEGESVMWIY